MYLGASGSDVVGGESVTEPCSFEVSYEAVRSCEGFKYIASPYVGMDRPLVERRMLKGVADRVEQSSCTLDPIVGLV